MDILKLDDFERKMILQLMNQGMDARTAVSFIINYGCEC
jgi:hypothetical protein